jgi:hypothetical protein
MTVEEQLRALCDHLDEQQAPVTTEEIIGERGLETFSGDTVPGRGGRRLAGVLAVAAAIVVVIAGWLMTSGDDTVEMVPADRPSSSAPSPTSATTSATFVSPRNGFSVQYPDSAESTVTPATTGLGWSFSQKVDEGFDVVDTGAAAVFRGASLTAGPEEAPIDERIDELLSSEDVLPGGCGVPRSRQVEIIIDGQPGRFAECPNRIEATVVFGGRLYVFTLSHDRPDAGAVFEAFASTIDLTPETAVLFPPMYETFVSPTYGYSSDYWPRGRPEPASQHWDPDDQPVEDINFDARFDAHETGFYAYFEAASTSIPEEVSIDEWVDTYVTPRSAGGCGIPRSEQKEIVVDGQPGWKAECEHSEATVVAGGRLYLFIGPNDERRWFDAWIATIELTPETAAVS